MWRRNQNTSFESKKYNSENNSNSFVVENQKEKKKAGNQASKIRNSR